MKIAIVGYSGSGKSTLARKLAELYQIDVLHFDTIQFLPDWVIRSEDEKNKLTEAFLDAHDSWLIDGNYSKLFYERRMAEGCKEKFDFEFVKWILWEGRTKRARERYRGMISKYGEKAIVIRNQKELDRYIQSEHK